MRREFARDFPLRQRLDDLFPCRVSLPIRDAALVWDRVIEQFGQPYAQDFFEDGYPSNNLILVEDDAIWSYLGGIFYFRDHRDAMMFRLSYS